MASQGRNTLLFIVAFVMVAMGLVMTGAWMIRPKPPAFGRNLPERWVALAEEGLPAGGPTDAHRQWERIAERLRETFDAGVPGFTIPSDSRAHPTDLAPEAVWSLEYGEWGHPLHAHGVAVIEETEPLVAEMEEAASGPLFDERWLDPQYWEDGRQQSKALLRRSFTSSWLPAQMRVAAESGDDARVLRLVRLARRDVEQRLEAPVGWSALLASSDAGRIYLEATRLAMDSPLEPATIREVASLLEIDLGRWERSIRWWVREAHLSSVQDLRFWGDEVAQEPLYRVAVSVIDGMTTVSAGNKDVPIWKDRLASADALHEELVRRHAVRAAASEVPLDEPMPTGVPAFTPKAVDAETSYTLPDVDLIARSRIAADLIEWHAMLAVIRAAAHRREHGEWPEKLTDAMTPQQARALLVDLPYEYERTNEPPGASLRLPGRVEDYERYLTRLPIAWNARFRDGMEFIEPRPPLMPKDFYSWKRLAEQGAVDLGPEFAADPED